MDIAICDDDKESIDRLLQFLGKTKEADEIKIDIYHSGTELLKEEKNMISCHVLFLDIEMEGASGLEVAARLREINRNLIIIFMSSHLQYVSDTFRLGAFQFLVKPIKERDFALDFERAAHTYRNAQMYYEVRWREAKRRLCCGDIYYIEAYNRHLYVHVEKEEYECVGKLSNEIEKLSPYGFIRCHQGFLVNISKIKEVGKNVIVLNNETEIPVSRKYKDEIMKAFCLYMAGKLV